MTVEDVLKTEKEEYVDFEIWAYTDNCYKLHTDYIKNIDSRFSFDVYKNKRIINYYVLNENEYNSTVNANADPDDFGKLYGDEESRVLVIALPCNWNDPEF